ncbi:MAG: DUF2061 domain-containing protein [Bacteroidetes bacterium]|nr:DUF2061 domain-containing protein [Bacteroidota bacterium]
MKEYHFRSIIKGITWRITGTIDTILIAFILSREMGLALSIGGIEVVTKMILYYLHERAWIKIEWGRHKIDDDKDPDINMKA